LMETNSCEPSVVSPIDSIHAMSFEFEKEALRASGVSDEDRIAVYTRKLDTLHRHLVRDMNPGHDLLSRAETLFDWLWIRKPSRYQRGGPFRLNEVIDFQVSGEKQVVGNCLGLTLLYTSLALRLEVAVGAVYLEHAFGIGPHVLTVFKAGDRLIDIEHTMPEGFDYKGHLDNSVRARWGERELVADIYHSRANECYEKRRYKDALKLYERAIALNPHYETAHLNRAIVLDKIGNAEEIP
jgi:tetratricopeptide (TPR) repeat protein